MRHQNVIHDFGFSSGMYKSILRTIGETWRRSVDLDNIITSMLTSNFYNDTVIM